MESPLFLNKKSLKVFQALSLFSIELFLDISQPGFILFIPAFDNVKE
jgi:hypothetical protein